MPIQPDTIAHIWHQVLIHGHQLGNWCYVILALLVMVEGPTSTLLGALAASAGLLQPIPVFISAACGNLTGDIIYNSLGRLVKTERILKHSHILGMTPAQFYRMEDRLRQNAPRLMIVAKLTCVLTIPVIICIGVLRVSYRRWFTADIFAEIIWTGSLVAGGYYIGEHVKHLEREFQYVAVGSAVLFLFVVPTLFRWMTSKWGRRTLGLDEEEESELVTRTA
jgi:membrane protein DedA with SNARE-associated domain